VQTQAAQVRAEGEAQACSIRAVADATVTRTIALANQQAETIRGDGDAQANTIFAAAYGIDPDFFSFYRSMQAYETALKTGDTRLVLSPDSEFFRYFGNPAARPKTVEPKTQERLEPPKP
jgi:membrane protease subunit HflC